MASIGMGICEWSSAGQDSIRPGMAALRFACAGCGASMAAKTITPSADGTLRCKTCSRHHVLRTKRRAARGRPRRP